VVTAFQGTLRKFRTLVHQLGRARRRGNNKHTWLQNSSIIVMLCAEHIMVYEGMLYFVQTWSGFTKGMDEHKNWSVMFGQAVLIWWFISNWCWLDGIGKHHFKIFLSVPSARHITLAIYFHIQWLWQTLGRMFNVPQNHQSKEIWSSHIKICHSGVWNIHHLFLYSTNTCKLANYITKFEFSQIYTSSVLINLNRLLWILGNLLR